MNEIYPMWVAAHGVMIVTPVHWFHGSSPLKLMMAHAAVHGAGRGIGGGRINPLPALQYPNLAC
jgi:multimeric flavodoxin WrbA